MMVCFLEHEKQPYVQDHKWGTIFEGFNIFDYI
jgi:hypothetical protein